MSSFRTRGGLSLAGAALLAAGCSNQDPVPGCDNCEVWSQVTAGLARYPDPHPSDPSWILYSTVEKLPNATDANREADEDIWIVHRGAGDAGDHPRWQLTDDSLGPGDNLDPRWSPSGTQIAFSHSTGGGTFAIYRMPVVVGAPGERPLTGAPEQVVTGGRDPTWDSETRLYFSRADKIHRIDLPAGAGPPTGMPVQLTFNPPIFSATDKYIDRHLMFAPDGGAVFNSTGRRNVASVFLRAFEIDDLAQPPDTTESRAWIGFQPPGSEGAYPLFVGEDTLRTPQFLQSIPVDNGQTVNISARRDSRFLADSTAEVYCDTLITVAVDLQPGDVDSVSYYFRVVRGALVVDAGASFVSVFWEREDRRATSNDFVLNPLLPRPGDELVYECLMPFAVQGGIINTARQETLIVSGIRGPMRDTVKVVVQPGDTTRATLFPPGTISGTVAFSDMPSPRPRATVDVRLSGFPISNALSDTTGAFVVPFVPAGTYEVVVAAGGYTGVSISGVVVNPPGDTPIGTVMLNRPPVAQALEPDLRGETLDTRPPVRRTARPSSREGDSWSGGASLESLFRAPGDAATIWRFRPDSTDLGPPGLNELLGSSFPIQTPAVSGDLGGGVRYLAYVTNEPGTWQLFVQRLQDWVPDGEPLLVEPPGTTDNLNCLRPVLDPRWVRGGAGPDLELLVTLGDCPNNGFEDLGIDDNPWAIGELRVWTVTVQGI